jgi:dTDP-D-glucose 4,6-dehydratase
LTIVLAPLLLLVKKMEGHENTDRLYRNLAINSHVSYNNFMNRTSREYNNIEGYQKQGRFEVFNIGSDDTITVTQIAHIVIEQLSLERDNVRKLFKNTLPGGRGWIGDVPDFWLDCSKLKNAGWSPKYNTSKGAVIHTCSEYINMNTTRRKR